MKKADKNSWKTSDMPKQNENFKIDITLNKQEFELLQNGWIPEEMEDKWFMYFEDNKLYIHRSWTGYCIYIVSFSDNYKVKNIIVNRDTKEYLCTDIEKDKLMAEILINRLTGRKGNDKLMDKYVKLK